MYKLSIITINLNNHNGLIKTVNSVISQTFKEFEFIVIDGNSTDGSKEYIESHKTFFTYSVSETDFGIYNAMNKGIDKATGEYILFLNSGDYLVSNVILDTISKTLHSIDIIYGNIFMNNKVRTFPKKLSLYFFFSDSIGHASTFIKRDLFMQYGKYNETNKIVSDWEFFIKTIILNNVSTLYLNTVISVFQDNGISKNITTNHLLVEESNAVLTNLFPDYIHREMNYVDSILSSDEWFMGKWISNKTYLYKLLLKIGYKLRIHKKLNLHQF